MLFQWLGYLVGIKPTPQLHQIPRKYQPRTDNEEKRQAIISVRRNLGKQDSFASLGSRKPFSGCGNPFWQFRRKSSRVIHVVAIPLSWVYTSEHLPCKMEKLTHECSHHHIHRSWKLRQPKCPWKDQIIKVLSLFHMQTHRSAIQHLEYWYRLPPRSALKTLC